MLEQLCSEQEGDLGGPRAVRMSMDDSDLADLAGGGLMSGHEILQLLQGMGESRLLTASVATLRRPSSVMLVAAVAGHGCATGLYDVVSGCISVGPAVPAKCCVSSKARGMGSTHGS